VCDFNQVPVAHDVNFVSLFGHHLVVLTDSAPDPVKE
jgi:hypothetical protein